jgi:hypothetical protein
MIWLRNAAVAEARHERRSLSRQQRFRPGSYATDRLSVRVVRQLGSSLVMAVEAHVLGADYFCIIMRSVLYGGPGHGWPRSRLRMLPRFVLST